MSGTPDLYTYKVKVSRIIDGDSVFFSEINLGFDMKICNQSCRVSGIDTPESRINLKRYPEREAEKELGLRAKDRLKELLDGEVTLQSLDRDKYGRILGNLFVEGENVSEVLVREGLACPYKGGTKKARVREDGTWGE